MSAPEIIPLWPQRPPGARGERPEDVPTLTIYCPPSEKVRAAVLIFPGGGYWDLMDSYEGKDFALWLNERGIAAFVLRYRLAAHGYHYPEITDDATRAIRHIRTHCAQWNIDPARIGVMGASAGGHLASFTVTHFDEGNSTATDLVERVSSKPDFGILCYAVLSFTAFESGTMKNLLGENPSADLVKFTSSELQVTAQTPPCFIWHTSNDPVVPAENALLFAQALQKQGVPYSLHLYPSGPHGIGLGVYGYLPGSSIPLHPWTRELSLWLERFK